MNKKLLGIDYGDSRIGLSLSSNSLALPYQIIENNQDTYNGIKNIVVSEGIEEIIVGLPLGKMGEETEISDKVRKFVKKLEANLEISVDFFDERLTTAQVKSMKVKGDDDAHAAALMLQSYLDNHADEF